MRHLIEEGAARTRRFYIRRRRRATEVDDTARHDRLQALTCLTGGDPTHAWGRWRTAWLVQQFRPLLNFADYWQRMLRSLGAMAVAIPLIVVFSDTVGRPLTEPGKIGPMPLLALTLPLLLITYILFFGLFSLPLEVLIAVSLFASPESASDTAWVVFIAAALPVGWAASQNERSEISEWMAAAWTQVGRLAAFARAGANSLARSAQARQAFPREPRVASSGPTLASPLTSIMWRLFLAWGGTLVLLAIGDGIGGAAAQAFQRIHRADPMYTRVSTTCLVVVLVLAAMDRWLAKPLIKQALIKGCYGDESWKSFRERRNLMVEVRWALITATIAFAPAAAQSSWLPFVGITAISAALIVPRIRLWRSPSA